MNVVPRVVLAALLVAVSLCGNAADLVAPECPHEEVETHVRQQFALYGPQSAHHEYFGFIYRHDGVMGSAVTRSSKCNKSADCVVDSSEASALIPRGAKVLGEWHTHPFAGSPSLSALDVKGARNNRHIKCYAAYYSKPTGEIYAWDPEATSVPTAMATRVHIGNYMERFAATGYGNH